ncbi:MAG: transcription-repair coupling factor [Clostridia bacterium]|nr:transcription-repair coupling factor [Clostridia bacterium]
MPQFVLYVASDYVSAQEVLNQLNSLGKKYAYLSPKEEVLVSNKGASVSSRAMRSQVLFQMQGELDGVVTTIEALCQKYPHKNSFVKNVISIAKNDSADIFDVAKRLVSAGYCQVDEITVMGDFTRRGDILDVYCPGYDNPVRIEFFGDDVEDIRVFDKQTKKSIQKIDRADVVPLNQFFEDDFDFNLLCEQVWASSSRQKLDPDAKTRLDSVVENVFVGVENKNFSNAWLLPFVKNSVLADYLPQDAVVVWDEPKQTADRVAGVYDEHYQRIAYLLSKGEILPESKDQLVDRSVLFGLFDSFAQTAFQGMSSTNVFFKSHEVQKFRSSPLVAYQNKMQMLCDDLKNWVVGDYRVVLYAKDNNDAKLLQDELRYNGLLVGIVDEEDFLQKGICICIRNVPYGFVDHDNKTVLIGVYDVLSKGAKKQKLKKSNDKIFTTPDIGDYVVHELHGIGLCQGIESIETSYGTKDYIVVKYKNQDTLYVPVDSTNMLSKYSGGDKAPKLSKLGGEEFKKIKARVKERVKEMAFDLLKLYAEREKARGFCYQSDSFLEGEFAKSFAHEETVDQLKCIQDITNDLESNKIMDRLVCGDVGFGKTEVALRAAFKVLASGRQVAFLAPTTILSEQHFKNAKKRLQDFGFEVKSLNRFRSKQEQSAIVDGLATGRVEMVCGTHRLLSKDVHFKNLGLLILDEEQRFGVEAKETIKNIKKNVDVLTLSATPIPRTLHMSLTGMRDISIIQTPPQERLPVETYVVESVDYLICDAIMREVNRGGQAFFVYNRVETIEEFAFKLSQMMPGVKFCVAHGQMNEGMLEKKIYEFTNGEYDVLVSSTIIENGIDIPNANTILVYDADKFGLSQLYQLRGRVGRSNRRAFAYFMYREDKILTADANKRLNAVLEYTELGSGFKIAMRDLEIRGAGNVLGKEQHGHMEKVGYDMYCKLLGEAVDELKGVKTKETIECTLDVAIDANAKDYITDGESRMAFYQRLSAISSKQDADELLDEITDVYGNPPAQVLNLLDMCLLKQKASHLGISEVVVKPGRVELCFFAVSYLQNQGVFDALEKFKTITHLDVTHKLAVVFDCKKSNMAKSFEQVCQFVDCAYEKNI